MSLSLCKPELLRILSCYRAQHQSSNYYFIFSHIVIIHTTRSNLSVAILQAIKMSLDPNVYGAKHTLYITFTYLRTENGQHKYVSFPFQIIAVKIF